MADTKTIPPYQIADNPHALIHCGPVFKESLDDERDLTVATSGGSGVVFYKDGRKVEIIEGASHENVGHNKDTEKKDAVAKAIVARNGDIHHVAEQGDVCIKAKNIYFEAMGDSPNGTFHILSNGPMTIACQQHLKCAAGAMCVVSAKSLDINAQVNIAGGLTKMKDPDLFSLASNFSWAALMKAITTKCK